MKTYISPWPENLEADFPRNLVILGATGSIGDSAAKVVRQHPGMFNITGLAGAYNVKKLAELALEFRPPYLGVLTPELAVELALMLPQDYKPEILTGPKGYEAMAALDEADMVLSSIVGAAGFTPTLAAAKAGKIIALANKESLVLGGHVIRAACHESGALVLPVDSEHNALFQGLAGHDTDDVSNLILTASGGPFRDKSAEFLQHVTKEQALDHPNWSMGAKISIDSSTLMNKGLEFIEACHLYGFEPGRVQVLVHPQSIIHSMVEYKDGSVLVHLGVPDMQIPIAYCMCHPKRVGLELEPLNLARIGTLTFEEPDTERFPCLRLAQEAYAAGPSHPVVLNAANEVAVDLFLKEKIEYMAIPAMIEKALAGHSSQVMDDPQEILELDRQTRREVLEAAGV